MKPRTQETGCCVSCWSPGDASMHKGRGREEPTEDLLGVSAPPLSRCPSRMVTPLPSEQAKVRVLGLVDEAQVAISSQVSLQSI